jgi:hypothetical protein
LIEELSNNCRRSIEEMRKIVVGNHYVAGCNISWHRRLCHSLYLQNLQ